MKPIDLRSDTLTQPTPAMREAMANAEVGDDVFEEDPTLKKLEELAAQKTGKESALFVPSGTMGNLISILSHCQRGDEILLGDRSHIFLHEVGGIAALGGVHPRIIPNNPDGTLLLPLLEHSIRPSDIHNPPTRLICLENTHNFCQGSPLNPEYMDSVRALAAKYGLKIHLDGARLFNAAVAQDINVKDLTRQADSVMFCLSKGLSAPVGSLVCSNRDFIQRARKFRKMVGGGMRQAGHLAAAGLVALESLVERLKEDHQNTQLLAEQLASVEGIELDPAQVKTNIIFFKLKHSKIDGESFLNLLEENSIKILMTDPGVFRAVLHREINREQVETIAKTVRSILTL
ncbi:MAG: low-specificity L-threonine aldolase [Nitrospina sp.]|jgi:threonine aldolase|nr:low-specificity L-threonine aldolase [Nitrospina sp.]MBT3511388.1 low-specificity L-threonine aldolase [Nitrospina sp.]MBT3876354.1 low-specificity L-threonine aldolase [Nitrospina sp.]MBT4049930.1 low-specificity L-threonine aldolase [Nitrospina sp.]MBT4556670.1 low-specificity L-threonine aldolase [Nitrospina sp.]